MEIGITSITRTTVARLDLAPTGGPAKAGQTRAAAAKTVSTGATAPLARRVHDEPLTRDQVRDLRKRIRAVDHAVRDVVTDRREHDHAAPADRANQREHDFRTLACEFRHELRVLARTARHVEHVLSGLEKSLQRFANGAGAAAGAATGTEPPAPARVHDEPLPVHDAPLPAPAAPQEDVDPRLSKLASSVFELLKFVKRTLLPGESHGTSPIQPPVPKRAATAFQVPPTVNGPQAPAAPAPVQPQQPAAETPVPPEQTEVDPRLSKLASSVFELLKFVKHALLPGEDPTQPVATVSFTRISGQVNLLA